MKLGYYIHFNEAMFMLIQESHKMHFDTTNCFTIMKNLHTKKYWLQKKKKNSIFLTKFHPTSVFFFLSIYSFLLFEIHNEKSCKSLTF